LNETPYISDFYNNSRNKIRIIKLHDPFLPLHPSSKIQIIQFFQHPPIYKHKKIRRETTHRQRYEENIYNPI